LARAELKRRATVLDLELVRVVRRRSIRRGIDGVADLEDVVLVRVSAVGVEVGLVERGGGDVGSDERPAAADGRSFDDLDPFTGEKEAVARANATSYGLGTNRRCLLAESTTADTDGLAARR